MTPEQTKDRLLRAERLLGASPMVSMFTGNGTETNALFEAVGSYRKEVEAFLADAAASSPPVDDLSELEALHAAFSPEQWAIDPKGDRLLIACSAESFGAIVRIYDAQPGLIERCRKAEAGIHGQDYLKRQAIALLDTAESEITRLKAEIDRLRELSVAYYDALRAIHDQALWEFGEDRTALQLVIEACRAVAAEALTPADRTAPQAGDAAGGVEPDIVGRHVRPKTHTLMAFFSGVKGIPRILASDRGRLQIGFANLSVWVEPNEVDIYPLPDPAPEPKAVAWRFRFIVSRNDEDWSDWNWSDEEPDLRQYTQRVECQPLYLATPDRALAPQEFVLVPREPTEAECLGVAAALREHGTQGPISRAAIHQVVRDAILAASSQAPGTTGEQS